MNERKRVGVVSVPWMGVPPKGQGSIAGKTHRLSELLADRYAFTIVGGATGRAPQREHPDIEYQPIDESLDRRYLDRLVGSATKLVGRGRHAYYQPLYHARYIRRAARALSEARCSTVLVHEFPQWLPVLRRALPDAELMLWGGADSFIEVDSLLPDVARADRLIGSSRFLADRFAERVPALAGRTHVVYSGIDIDTFRPGSEERSNHHLLFAGRITPEKGVHLLVDAFRILADTRPELELTLAGPPWVTDPALLGRSVPHHLPEVEELVQSDYRAELMRRAGPHADRVHMPGVLDREGLCRALQSTTVFCHAVLCEEGFGQVVAEALACGTPTIVSDLGAPPEFVDDGRTGRVVRAGVVDELVVALQQLLDNPSLRASMSSAARRSAEERLSAGAAALDLGRVIDGDAPAVGRGAGPGGSP